MLRPHGEQHSNHLRSPFLRVAGNGGTPFRLNVEKISVTEIAKGPLYPGFLKTLRAVEGGQPPYKVLNVKLSHFVVDARFNEMTAAGGGKDLQTIGDIQNAGPNQFQSMAAVVVVALDLSACRFCFVRVSKVEKLDQLVQRAVNGLINRVVAQFLHHLAPAPVGPSGSGIAGVPILRRMALKLCRLVALYLMSKNPRLEFET